MIGIGIIGCGKIAQIRHLPEYSENKFCKIIGLFDLNRDRAEELAAIYKAKAYRNIDELLADDEIEAVSICTSNSTHAEISIQALNAGKHVLCEKPMATTLEDCLEMTETAGKKGRILMIAHNQRLTRAHIVAKELMDRGEIGEVLSFRTAFGHGGPETWSVDPGKNVWFFDREKASMGAMADLGVHKTDLIQFLTGKKIVKTAAVLTTIDKRDDQGNLIGVDDNSICIYTLENGAVGTMASSWTYYGSEDNSTIIYGTEGMLRIYDDPNYAIVMIRKNGERISYDLEQIQTNERQTKSNVIDKFVECVINKSKPDSDGESVLSAMKAVFASIESSRRGCSIEIE